MRRERTYGRRGLTARIAVTAVAAAVLLTAGERAESAPPNAFDRADQGAVSDTDPTWSRQNVIAFLRRRSSVVWIVLKEPAGRERTLVKLPPGETMRLSFSPDGRRLAVIANFRVYVVTVTTGALRRLGPAHEYDWGPDSRTLVTNPYFEQTHPMRIIRVSDRRIIRTLVRGSSPDWSGPAAAIAFSQTRPDDLSDLYRIPPGGGRPKLMARNSGLPAWSPNGRLLAFSGQGAMWLMNMRRGTRHRIAPPTFSLPKWSPGGRYLALWDQNRNIRITTTSGQGVLRLTGARPEWSPNGKRIAFSSIAQCDHTGISVAPFPGGPTARITGRC